MVILTLRWWLALGYAIRIPAWEAYDEPYHAAYVVWLAAGGPLPPPPDNLQRIQPPAYYLIMAGFARLSQSDVHTFTYPPRNPYFYAPNGGVRYALPRPDPDPFVPTLIALRLASALLSLLTVAVSYRAARLMLPVGGAVAAAGLVAFWPQYAFNGSMVTNDAGAALIGAMLIERVVAIRRRGPGSGRLILAVVVAGIGLMVKLSVAPLLVAMPIALIGRVPARHLLRIGLIGAAGIGLVVLMLSRQSGVLLPFLGASPSGDPAPLALIRYLGEGRHALILPTLGYGFSSSFGLFGWGNVPLPPIFTALWAAGALLAVIGGLRGGWRGMAPLLIGLLAGIGAGVALSVYYANIGLLNGRYLLPGIAAWALLVVGGFAAWGRWGRPLSLVILIGLIALNVWIGRTYLPAIYARPTPLLVHEQPPRPRWDALAPGIALIGADVGAIQRREVPLCLYWQAVGPIRDGYVIRLELVSAAGGGYGWVHTLPAGGNHPADQWTDGERFRDCYRLPIRTDFPAAETGYVKISVTDGAGRVLGSVILQEDPIRLAAPN